MRRRLAAALLALLLCMGPGCLRASAAVTQDGVTIWGYSEGLALAEKDGQWGYANAARQIVIPLQFDSAVSFSLGVAAVNLNGRLGVIRQDGAYLIRPEYDTLMPIDCGLYLAQKGTRWGVVSIVPLPNGRGGKTNIVYDLIYDSAQVVEQAGVQVLCLTRNGERVMLPLFELPALLAEKRVPSAQFPLNRGRLPRFSDVKPQDWYAVWVDIAYNVGLTSGVGDNQYGPGRTLTVAEALKLAATMDSRYKDDNFHLQGATGGGEWYRPAVDYCLASGILRRGEFGQEDYNRPVTRAEMAAIVSRMARAEQRLTLGPA